MNIPWNGDRCVVCLTAGTLTEEHLIPRSLGGALTCNFLCKQCNDEFGSGFEGTAKHDPSIRLGAIRLKAAAPSVHATVEEGQRYLIKAGPTQLTGRWRDGAVVGPTTRIVDGSLMVPVEQASRKLREILRADGQSEAFIAAAVATLENAPAEQPTNIGVGSDVHIVNWKAESPGPDFRESKRMSDLVLVKIAYEFMALLIGEGIYSSAPPITQLREALHAQDAQAASFVVDRRMTREDRAVHGIAFEGNKPYAQFQVRLFGSLAFRVHFLNIVLDHPTIAYTHDLSTGAHGTNA